MLCHEELPPQMPAEWFFFFLNFTSKGLILSKIYTFIAVFEGKMCSIRDVCSERSTCVNSICINDPSDPKGFRCGSCAVGFTGDRCQLPTDECATQPCLNNGTCSDGFLSYSCSCLTGYEGQHELVFFLGFFLMACRLFFFCIQISVIILYPSELRWPDKSTVFSRSLRQRHSFSLSSALCSHVWHWRALWAGQCLVDSFLLQFLLFFFFFL